MACTTDHYKFVIDRALGLINGVVDLLTPYLGKPLSLVATAVLISPLAALLAYFWKVLIPRFVRWYYEETITQRAKEYWRRNCIGTGMTIPGAKISIAIGFLYFFLVRFAASVPAYYWVTIPLLVFVFIGVAVIGYYVGGNVPETDAGRNRYFRKFHAPTVTGLGLGVATVVWDFLVHTGSVVLTHLQST